MIWYPKKKIMSVMRSPLFSLFTFGKLPSKFRWWHRADRRELLNKALSKSWKELFLFNITAFSKFILSKITLPLILRHFQWFFSRKSLHCKSFPCDYSLKQKIKIHFSTDPFLVTGFFYGFLMFSVSVERELTVSWCFQIVEKGCIGKKWVNEQP